MLFKGGDFHPGKLRWDFAAKKEKIIAGKEKPIKRMQNNPKFNSPFFVGGVRKKIRIILWQPEIRAQCNRGEEKGLVYSDRLIKKKKKKKRRFTRKRIDLHQQTPPHPWRNRGKTLGTRRH